MFTTKSTAQNGTQRCNQHVEVKMGEKLCSSNQEGAFSSLNAMVPVTIIFFEI